MPVLERQQLIARPRDELFTFFADAANLERLTPASLRFNIVTPTPVVMRQGAVIDYRLKLSGLPFKWRTVIACWEPPFRFVDVQQRGPYKLWRHTHTFEQVPGGTLVRDRVEYALPFGPLGVLAHRLFVARQLEQIFAYRQRTLSELFPAPA